MSAIRNHLQCINGHYRYRRRWPKNVRPVAKGEYFIRHLATSSLEEALRLRPTAEIEFFSEVDRLAGLVEAKPRDVTHAEATMLVSRWFSSQIRQDAENDLHNPVSDPEKRSNALEASRLMAEFVRDQVGSGELEPFEVHASWLFEEHGIKVDPHAPGFRVTAQLMARADRERWLLREARLSGDFGYQPSDPVFSSALRDEQHKKAPPTVGGLIEAFKADRAPRWSPSSVAAYAPVERVLREVLGSARQLDTLGREDGRKLFDTVRQLPKGLGKSPKLKGLSVAEAIKTGLSPISPKSINATYLSAMKATFRFAVQEQWMAADPLAGLSVVDPVAEADKRDPFSIDQLNKIFATNPWTPRDTAPRGRPLHYWGPLIALLLGMRRGEIAQLRTDDVTEVENVPVLLVRAGHGKRLKTTNARRMLPVHPELLRLGLLDYVGQRKASGAELLWEGEEPDSRGQWGDGFSDWFVRLLKSHNISGNRLGLHSFRHNFQVPT